MSAKDQNPERQFLAMQEQKIDKKNIYLDKMSGSDFSRPQYLKLLKKLKKGDALVIKSIDRLGRNYGEILEQWRYITKQILAYVAETERTFIKQRQAEGIAAAKRKGVQFGCRKSELLLALSFLIMKRLPGLEQKTGLVIIDKDVRF